MNLAGRSVDCVKTPDRRDEILRSRVESTRVLGHAVQHASRLPGVWVQMSTAHIYGDPPSAVCTERSPIGEGLAPLVGERWEAAFEHACPPGVRRVVLRTSFVIGPEGGAMARLAALARRGLGGTIGHGRQGMSWIHHRDMNRIILRAMAIGHMSGVYIATSPNPASNRDFMRALRRALGVRFGLPAPALGVRLAAPLVMRTDPDLALYGRYCVPERLVAEGFAFSFPDLDGALRDVVCRAE